MSLPFYLQPRMLALHGAAIATVAAMISLGFWQLARWDAEGQRQERTTTSPLPPADIGSVVTAGQDMAVSQRGRPVTASGTYLADAQVLLPGRAREGKPGFWVLTPLQTPTGDVAAVLRGWVRSLGDASAVPAGRVQVAGQLQQAEPVNAGDDPLPAGQAHAASPVVLASLVDAPLLPGLLVLQSQTPPLDAAGGPLPVRVRVEGGGRGGAGLRNLAYALQWWVFVGFAVWLWQRLVRDAAVRPVKIEA